MDIRGNSSGNIGHSILFFYNPKEVDDRATEEQLLLKYGSKHDPERPPEKKLGDRYIMIGVIAGMIVGTAVGARISGLYGSFVGVIVGGIIGLIAGSVIKKWVAKDNSQKL